MLLRLCIALLPLLAVAVPAPQPQPQAASSSSSSSSSSPATAAAATTSVPYYSAPNTFTPTASGSSPLAGSVVTLTNTNGPGSVSDSFIYTKALSTVPPTGNVTVVGTATGQSNLQPDPTNLQTAAAHRLSLPSLGLGGERSFAAEGWLAVGVVAGGMLLGGLGVL
ncbi:hypothetical protein BCR35DRAFT_310236 [Leucosporidium creatinivorum]|uniref:Uncharacterized protein n=1 Tax=Leucosporidium creatinivorum TaxID=106004 RepID=A0A1Y2D6P6_9BASI|nr:hypothetical protein BCR35DRAFT_310236 [Leucosporidium creatinivorum]